MIHYLLFYSTTLATIWVIYRSVQTRAHFNGHLFFWFVTLLVIYFPAIGKGNAGLRENTEGLLFFYFVGGLFALFILPIGLFSSARILRSQSHASKLGSFGRKLVGIAAAAYAVILVTQTASTVAIRGGWIQSLSVDRLSEYLSSGFGSGILTEAAATPLLICYLMMMARLVKKKKTPIAAAMFCLMQVHIFYTTNTRLPVLFPAVAFAWGFMHIRAPRFLYANARTLFVGGVALALVVFSVGNFFRNGQIESLLRGDVEIVSQLTARESGELNYLLWVHDMQLKIDSGLIPFDFGRAWIYRPVINVIPRSVWPDKPVTSTSNLLSSEVFGWKQGENQTVHTFTLAGEGYWQFGYLGVFLAPAIYVLCSYILARLIRGVSDAEILLPFFMVSLISFVRAEQPIFKVIVWCSCLLLVRFLTNKSRPHQAVARRMSAPPQYGSGCEETTVRQSGTRAPTK